MTTSPEKEKFYKYKEVSTRLMRPTQHEINVHLVVKYLSTWQASYEMDDVIVYDEGLAQYLLVDQESHHKFYAALILDKPSLRCRVISSDQEPPVDELEEEFGNRLSLVGGSGTTEEAVTVKKLTEKLEKKNYKFVVA